MLVYPHEGVATADYPFMLLNDARARRLPEGRRLPQGRRGADLAGAADAAPADHGRGGGAGGRPLPQGRRRARRAAVLARPRARRRPDRRLPQRVPPADRLHLRARHQRQHGGGRAGASSWCRRCTTSPAPTLADRSHRQADRPREGLDAAVLRPSARACTYFELPATRGKAQGRAGAGGLAGEAGDARRRCATTPTSCA